MKILVACEESQAVTIELRRLGHEAYSCDLVECSGGHPEWHLQQDVIPLLDGDCTLKPCSGEARRINGQWDMIIAHPPCTYLSNAGAAYFSPKWGEKKISERRECQREAEMFFMLFVNAKCDRIAIENPVGCMSTRYQKPTQCIQPYWFGDHAQKKTCLWLKGIKPLDATNIVDRGEIIGNYSVGAYAYGKDENGKWLRFSDPKLARLRSKTFPGIARAMAEQWAGPAESTP